MKELCNFIVKEEGICIYRVPEEPPKCYNTCAHDNMEGCSDPSSCLSWTDKYSDWKEAVKQAQSSAILCEDQSRAKEIIKSKFGHDLDQMTINTKGYIYPVPGIEFEEIEVVPEYPIDHTSYPPMIKVARLIEHTAEKESPEIDKEEFETYLDYGKFMLGYSIEAAERKEEDPTRYVFEKLSQHFTITRKP